MYTLTCFQWFISDSNDSRISFPEYCRFIFINIFCKNTIGNVKKVFVKMLPNRMLIVSTFTFMSVASLHLKIAWMFFHDMERYWILTVLVFRTEQVQLEYWRFIFIWSDILKLLKFVLEVFWITLDHCWITMHYDINAWKSYWIVIDSFSYFYHGDRCL